MKTITTNLHINLKNKGFRAFPLMVTLFVSFILVSCQQNNRSVSDADVIRQKISEYNQQIVDLNQKVSDLEKDLEKLGETTQNRIRIPVAIRTLEPEPFEHFFTASAKVEAIQEAMISPEINGQIREIPVAKGQKVRRGQVLARLNTSVIENNISELKTSLQLAETVYNRQKRLWSQEIGSEIQYLETKNNYESLQSRLKTLEAQLDMSVMRAPFDGVVDEIFAKEGEMAMPGMRVMQLLNLDQLFINADISEAFLPSVNPNDRVILRFPSFPEFEERVPIFRIGNVINPENRTFRLQLRINNRDEMFKPNMVASLGINTFNAPDALVLSSILIKQDTQGFYVYIADENRDGDLIARKVYIERGLTGEGRTMITSGLEAGARVITSGHNRISDGALISITENNPLAER